jgi:hypothetical protein
MLVPFRGKSTTYYIDFERYTDDRPKVDDHSLSDEIHNWLIDNNIDYKLEYVSEPKGKKYPHANNWFIVFENKSQAMLFKLTWG